jgi:microcin C transport system ATP-binding protein
MSHLEHTLLSITDLSTCFNKDADQITAVNHVSLNIKMGETLALVGESGSGKSVLAHSILQLLPYPKAHHPNGSIEFNGIDLLKANKDIIRAARGHDIAMIFQEPMTALNPLQTVEKQIAECLHAKKSLNKSETKNAVIELLKKVQIPNPETRLKSYPHELSGGQRQRVMIAMAIANQPELLIADEPTTALDVTVQAEILNLLKNIQAETDMAILLITHDLNVVKHYADRVAVMKHGEIVESNTTKELFDNCQHPYTQMLLKHEIQEKNPETSEKKIVLNAKNITVKYRKGASSLFKKQDYFSAVKNASFTLNRGETLGIVGESGCGKSTLANAILKLVRSEGEIILDGDNISILNEKAFRPLRKKIQIVFQDPFASLSPRLNITEIVGEGLKSHAKLSKSEIDAAVVEVLNKVGLDPSFRFRYPHEFSGGQRQRIAIARAIIMKPDCIVLDEPTSALDRSVQFQVLDLLLQLQRELSLTYLFISHDLRLVKAFCHNVLVMRHGEIVESGKTESVFTTPSNQYTAQLIKATL